LRPARVYGIEIKARLVQLPAREVYFAIHDPKTTEARGFKIEGGALLDHRSVGSTLSG